MGKLNIDNVLIYNRKRIVFCVLIGIITCSVSLTQNLWQNGLVFWGLSILMMPSEINLKNNIVFILGWIGAASAITFLLVQLTVNASIHAVGLVRISYNVLIIMIFVLIFYVLSGNLQFSTISVTTLLILVATADYYVLRFRGREIVPADFFSIRTAFNVAEGFNFIPGVTLVFSWLQFIEYVVVCKEIKVKPNILSFKKRLVLVGAALLFTLYMIWGCKNVKPHHFGTSGAGINGFIVNFLVQIDDMKVDPPDGYNDETVYEIEKKYSHNDKNKKYVHNPDIIVIMDESFSDFEVLGEELRTNQEVTPFIDSLTENTVRGYALSSVFGGDTANSEYEFLTGNSMLFLPESSIPYQQFIKENRYSLARYLKEKGYYTLAMHPFLSSGWMRTTVYPFLGFDEYEFIEAFPQKNLIRGFVSDEEMFDHLIQRYEQLTSEDSSVFIFGVTMQNHGGYEYSGEDFVNTIDLIGYRNEYPRAEQFLSLIHESDIAVQHLVEYFSNIDREAVIVFFGDHLPSLEEGFFNEVHGGSFGSDEQFSLYKVPFFIWANYDIMEEENVDTSINYLSAKMLDAAGVEMNGYQQFLIKASTVLPEMNVLGYRPASMDRYVFKTEDTNHMLNEEEQEIIREYSYLQYNNISGKNVNDSFYNDSKGE